MPNLIDDHRGLRKVQHIQHDAVTVWHCDKQFMNIFNRIRKVTLLTPPKLYHVWQMAKGAPPGAFWECGVYKGGTAHMLSHLRPIEMFDTFEGIPEKGENDSHHVGDFACSEAYVSKLVPRGKTHKGPVPTRFFDDDIALCHSDVDQEQATWDVLQYVYPRLVTHGVLVIDDYAWPHCYGCGKAVFEFFEDKPEAPVVNAFGQATVVKR